VESPTIRTHLNTQIQFYSLKKTNTLIFSLVLVCQGEKSCNLLLHEVTLIQEGFHYILFF